jgi:hypothetical protein
MDLRVTGMTRVVLLTVLTLVAFAAAAQEFRGEPFRVATSEALYAALEQVDPPELVELAQGEYAIDRPMTVPDGTTLVGAGVMRYDAAGLPAGFEPGAETTLRVTQSFPGDALALANRASIRGLVVHEFATGGDAVAGRDGSTVVVASRAPGDVVNASVVECEIHNSNSFGFAEEGPTGHAVLVMSRNPRRHLDPPPHGDATLDVQIERTIIRAPVGGGALFAINFAPRATVRLELTRNRIEGPVIVTGGVSRPELVTEARTIVRSEHNQYGAANGPPHQWAWTIIGASSTPHYPHPYTAGARLNSVEFRSNGDRIDGAISGVHAIGGRRFHSTSGPVSDNRAELDLQDLQIRTVAADGADLVLRGALAEPDPELGTDFPVGERNVLRIRMDGATGSGVRANVCETDSGATAPADPGVGNRVEIVGAAAEFLRRNQGFEPPPPSACFVGDAGAGQDSAATISREPTPGTPP